MSDTFNFTIEDVLSQAEPANSPNVPFNDWVFQADANGQLLKYNGRARDGFDVEYFLVVPYNRPDATPNWVYINAVLSDSALGILFDSNEMLLKRAQFGVYNVGGQLIVSNNPLEVKKGIADDVRLFRQRRSKP